MNYMKISIAALIVTLMLITTSCMEQITPADNVDLTENIVGNYSGTMIKTSSSGDDVSATANIAKITNSSIEISFHCELLDTMITFDLYDNRDSIMVCLTGDDFDNHYGHSKSGMHHMDDDDDMNDWGHHMDDDHQTGDHHFGGFEMNNHTFYYSFWDDSQNKEIFRFEGMKL
ncbi:MAG: hypothetical protein PF588_05875 [Candidatus Kapabacteria bacterium]|jgi:hypothetical protein|nr:hypothetical protein [Candidatus Kapabacteria bacterium]